MNECFCSGSNDKQRVHISVCRTWMRGLMLTSILSCASDNPEIDFWPKMYLSQTILLMGEAHNL